MLSLQSKARALLDKNTKSGNGYFYIAPSLKKYPHQWSWDSSFHAIVNCYLGEVDLAQKEILTLLSKMYPDGKLPHLIHHDHALIPLISKLLRRHWPDPHRSPLVQPPVIALAIQKIWECSEDLHFLKETLPLLEKHFEWLRTNRSFGNLPLVSIFSPWESGLDHKPSFDRSLGKFSRLPLGLYIALYLLDLRMSSCKFDCKEIAKRRYFEVKEVLFNTIYALGLESLGMLFSAIGDHSKAENFYKLNKEVEKAILNKCYHPVSQLYFDINMRTNTLIRKPTISSLMPLMLKNISRSRCEALIKHLRNPEEFWPPFPIPSVPLNSPHFCAQAKLYLWRGPTWINTNWLIVNGLRRNGYFYIADEIAHKSKELVNASGFREYYNPITGKGGGEKELSWSALAAIM